jgi:glycosyltransferase involved in cell wall biosynthesis
MTESGKNTEAVQKKTLCIVGGEDAHKRIELAREMIGKGWNITILGTRAHEYPAPIRFVNYSLNRKLNPFSDLKTMLFYRSYFSRETFDVVQTFDTKPAFLLPLALVGKNTRIVRTITGLGTVFMNDRLKYRILKKLYSLLHRLASLKVAHTTFQNEEDLGYFRKNRLVSASNSSIIPGSGIELPFGREIAPRKNNPPTFICVARIVYEKGIVNYLEAARKCREKGRGYRFLLVGPLEEESTRLNTALLDAYSDVVEWLGPRSDIEQLLLESDVFVLPTFREGLSRVILEACAAGLPVITTDVPGTRDIIRQGIEGFLTKVNDSEGLAEAMMELGENPHLADQFAQNALERVEAFSLKEISNTYDHLYHSTL